jgi:hypothetical protein
VRVISGSKTFFLYYPQVQGRWVGTVGEYYRNEDGILGRSIDNMKYSYYY